jgi:hypothetical protein
MMCKRGSMGFRDPENSYIINFPIERETSPKLQEIPKGSREIGRRKFVHGFASASLTDM